MLATTTTRPVVIKATIIALTAGVLLCVLELGAYLLIVVNGTNFYLPLELVDMRAGGAVGEDASIFDRELGWERPQPNDHGYRGESRDVERAAIALFGDSFTQGAPVIEESWAYLLEQRLERPVLNFGVGGYGPDQAYLRFEKRYVGQLHTPYVALAVMSENIARVINRYRGFYRRRRSASLTKPMFHRRDDGSVHLLPNPVQSVDERAKLADPDFLAAIGADDYWYAYYQRLGLNHFVRFPYSGYLLKALPYYVQRAYRHRIQSHREYEHLYEEDGPTAILRFIIERFVTRAEEIGVVPLVVFLPNWKDMVDYQETGHSIYEDFFRELETERSSHVYDALSYFAPYLDQGDPVSAFFISRLNGHYNFRGERIVAEGFLRTLLAIDSTAGLLEANDGV